MWWLAAGGILFLAFAALPTIISSRHTSLKADLASKTEAVIVFAHPDDETMFFLPLITLFHRLGMKFRLLCLSTGDYDGLGRVRIQELKLVGARLGAVSTDIVNNQALKDGPRFWSTIAVTEAIEQYLSAHKGVDAIFTFDVYGVSGHANHVSVFRGVSGVSTLIPRYTLNSVALWRKYIPFLDFFISLVTYPPRALVAVNLDDPLLALTTMRMYGSQNVWFRKLFSVFSRYSYINDFTRI